MPITGLPYVLDSQLKDDATHLEDRLQANFDFLQNNIPSGVPVVTTLPTNPTAAPEVNLAVSWTDTGGTARRVLWGLRWDATTSHWYFTGGTPMFDFVDTEQAIAATFSTFQDLATVGPKLTVPFTGVYLPAFSWYVDNTSAGAQGNTQVGLKVNALAVDTLPTAGGLASLYANGAFQTVSVAPTRPYPLTAADAIKMQYRSLSNVATGFGIRSMSLTPVYVN